MTGKAWRQKCEAEDHTTPNSQGAVSNEYWHVAPFILFIQSRNLAQWHRGAHIQGAPILEIPQEIHPQVYFINVMRMLWAYVRACMCACVNMYVWCMYVKYALMCV